MSNDWFARRLGQQAPPSRQSVPQQRYQPQHQQPQYQPQHQPQHQPQQPMPGQRQMSQAPPSERVTPDNLFQMMGFWKGGPARKADPDPCPECGSPHYYSRATSVARGPAPAPHCFDCGFSGGLFHQGDPAVWGSTG